jgi:hypothetical protein
MGGLILRTRLSMLRRNLEEVPHAVARVDASREYLSNIAATIAESKILSLARRVESAVHDAPKALAEGETEEAKSLLESINDTATQIHKTVKDLKAITDEALRHSLDLSQSEIATLLQREANAQWERVGELQKQLNKGAAPADIWTSYREQLYVGSQRVFTVYVEVLGGLALRQAGLDDGICRMADALTARPKLFLPPNVHWGSLTVPAQREALDETVSQILRLGFPEWTIWALPLAAHEFAHVIVGDHGGRGRWRPAQR